MPDATSQPAARAKPRRSWLRFSLRTMLVVVALFGIWLGIIANRANRQRSAVETIRNAGGEVWYDHGGLPDSVGDPFADDSPPGPAWLRNLIGIDYCATVVGIRFDTREQGDQDLFALIADLPHLQYVSLAGPRVTDARLAELIGLAELNRLLLSKTCVTDSGLRHLEGLPRLKHLILCDRKTITDAGLQDLKRAMPDLKIIEPRLGPVEN